ncbi:hypothetical protein I7I53_00325 [Histoplasma capsulatum var. duboisii H88]|uniref:Uncharacterized protein n=1 Tax=Ajellomyces capsulatus (strain H88) TaxID=544711 RepID=A0A8A1LKI4_AJEC8|nr:hypothetical protein I7I53_00325 [Histoplasma capsulatum var. duboisii H88]
MTAAATYGGSNCTFIERLLAIRVEYIRLGYTTIPNFIFFDKLLNGLTKGWASFVKDRMDQAARDDARPLEDDFLGICKDILLRLPLNDITKDVTGYTKDKDATRDAKNKDNKNIKKRCSACKIEGHDESNC